METKRMQNILQNELQAATKYSQYLHNFVSRRTSGEYEYKI